MNTFGIGIVEKFETNYFRGRGYTTLETPRH